MNSSFSTCKGAEWRPIEGGVQLTNPPVRPSETES